MPELPEVEVVRRGLDAHVVGRAIATADFFGARVARRHLPGPADLSERLSGQRVRAARRRGKYLWLELGDHESSDAGLIVHLGMSGQLLVAESGSADPRHLHARFRFDDTGPELRFVDQRTFGGVALADLDADGVPVPIRHIAPDPFEAAYDRGEVIRRIKAKDSAIKRVLLDQGVVSGIGNIYADEALWRARVHPASRRITVAAAGRLRDSVRDVLEEGIEHGGTTLRDYRDATGGEGDHQNHLDCYGRAELPCRRCGEPLRRSVIDARSTVHCTVCQVRGGGS